MKVPLTGYGWPQVVIYPGILLLLMLLIAMFGAHHIPMSGLIVTEVLLALVLGWALSFFRDPPRDCPQSREVLLSPADGRVTDVEVIEDNVLPGGPILRIGIFLSIFNVHINRAPCRVQTETTTYKPGLYRNALNPESSRVNESNTILFTQQHAPHDRLAVRQISGAIARHIVCRIEQGQILDAGEKFGMIKFGSRTELYVPARDELNCQVSVGDTVKAGLTVLARYTV
ncbi:phosphatidylserine decarboxylase [Planctomycetota bacterium]